MDRDEDLLEDCLRSLLRPLASFCVRHGLGVQRVLHALKQAMVSAAEAELARSGTKANASRISLMTGIQRKEIRSLKSDETHHAKKGGLLTRIIGRWLDDRRYRDEHGNPRALSCSGESSEFHSLVSNVSQDLNPYTVLAEMERAGIIERDDSQARLLQRAFVPRGDYQQGFRMLASDTENIARAVEENIFGKDSVPHLHLRTEYDNIAVERLPEIKAWLLREGSAFQRRVREYLSLHDKDINKELRDSAGGGKVAATAFSYVSEPDSTEGGE